MQQCIDSKRKKLFFGLLLIEIVIIILSIIGGSFSSYFFITLMRIILLIVANYCVDPQWATLYSVFALLSAIYAFDPVGLFLTGHGQIRSFGQNIALTIAFLLSIAASYIGYLYSKQLVNEQISGGNQNSYPSYQPYSQPSNQNNSNIYGGSNYMYQPNTVHQNTYSNHNTKRQQKWKPFTGHGHSLS